MPRILVNYRRDDSAAYAGRLADRLREHFGRENVFVDIDTIRPGEDFVDRIDQSIAACDVLVAVIGKSWLTAVDPKGRRRLDREDDFVRTEIAKALERHLRVIPALVGDAGLPEAAQLPQDIVAMSRRQAIEISDSRFHHDVDLLIEALSDTPGLSPQPAQLRQPLRDDGRPGRRESSPVALDSGWRAGDCRSRARRLAFTVARHAVWRKHNRRGRVERVPVRQCSCRHECPALPSHARGGRVGGQRRAWRIAASADDRGGACRKDRYSNSVEGSLQRALLPLR